MPLKSISFVKTKVLPDVETPPLLTRVAKFCKSATVLIPITFPVISLAVIEPSMTYFVEPRVVVASAVVVVVYVTAAVEVILTGVVVVTEVVVLTTSKPSAFQISPSA